MMSLLVEPMSHLNFCKLFGINKDRETVDLFLVNNKDCPRPISITKAGYYKFNHNEVWEYYLSKGGSEESAIQSQDEVQIQELPLDTKEIDQDKDDQNKLDSLFEAMDAHIKDKGIRYNRELKAFYSLSNNRGAIRAIPIDFDRLINQFDDKFFSTHNLPKGLDTRDLFSKYHARIYHDNNIDCNELNGAIYLPTLSVNDKGELNNNEIHYPYTKITSTDIDNCSVSQSVAVLLEVAKNLFYTDLCFTGAALAALITPFAKYNFDISPLFLMEIIAEDFEVENRQGPGFLQLCASLCDGFNDNTQTLTDEVEPSIEAVYNKMIWQPSSLIINPIECYAEYIHSLIHGSLKFEEPTVGELKIPNYYTTLYGFSRNGGYRCNKHDNIKNDTILIKSTGDYTCRNSGKVLQQLKDSKKEIALAALTILNAWLKLDVEERGKKLHGCYQDNYFTKQFMKWNNVVRGAIVWAFGDKYDPVKSRHFLNESK